jgi:hypothetical protein
MVPRAGRGKQGLSFLNGSKSMALSEIVERTSPHVSRREGLYGT